MRVRRSLMLGVVSVAALAADAAVRAPVPPAESPAESAASGAKVLHLKLRGDLDCMAVAGALEKSLAKAREDSTDVIVLEVGGNCWRGDVLAEVLRSVAGASAGGGGGDGGERPRVVVWLNDPADGRVGTGQAAIGAVAAKCYLAPKTEIVFEGTDDLRALAPAGTVWEEVESAVQGPVWGGLRERGRETLLAALLPWPRGPMWAVLDRPPGAGARLERLVVGGAPTAESARTVPVATGQPERGGGPLRVRIETSLAVTLGLACGQAGGIGQIMAAEGVRPRPMTRAEVAGGLPEARERLGRELAAIDAAKERLDKVLDAGERARGFDVERRRRAAGREALPLADESIKRLMEVEALAAEFPELRRAPPPGCTVIELTPTRLSTAWHDAFQDRRDGLAALRARAVRLAE
jgi:uncharacterized membrane protein